MRVVAALACICCATADARVLDDFTDARAWKAVGSDQVRASLRADPRGGLCLDYDFAGVSGYALLKRDLPLEFPADYAFGLRMRGSGPRNDFQFKLVDASGENVWWNVRAAHVFRPEGETLRIRKRQVAFAWGPATEKALRSTASIELVVAASMAGGGRGTMCFDRLTLDERAPLPALGEVKWRAVGSTLQADLGAVREFNGIALRWKAGARAADYDLEGSVDGKKWRPLRKVRGGAGDFDALFLPEAEARHLRLRPKGGNPDRVRIAATELPDSAEWPDMNAVLMRRAKEAPRGAYPRAWLGEQSYWTMMAADGGGAHSALISEDGAIEAGRGGFSVEPFVEVGGGRLLSWADVRTRHRLRDGYAPIVEVGWSGGGATLELVAAATEPRGQSRLVTSYKLQGASALILSLRPLQVNPPQQFLGLAGGISRIESIGWCDGAVRVNGREVLRTSEPPTRIASSGDGVEGLASLTLAWEKPETVAIAMPLAPDASAGDASVEGVARAQAATAEAWSRRLTPVGLTLPSHLRDSLRTALAHMLMSRDGPALQPGTRAYARTWIRDGAMMVSALLRMGETSAAREFVDWFAPRIFASGKVPCCVDARGSDPVVENDSHGQFIFAVAEVWRYTRDERWLVQHWPRVDAATRYMESLRQSERVPENRAGARAPWWGMMPKSISHEGYSDRPVHSYWDDFWALRGFKDAAAIAAALGKEAEARDFARWRDEFSADLAASIRATAKLHGIDYVAGSAELGDFDATSTTMALDPAQAADLLPPGMLEATFERYWNESRARAEGKREWKDYTPYEWRSVGALTRLGQRERALAMAEFFFGDQRPKGWNQWAEVVSREPRTARFLGDMPHAWVASDFIRSALDLLAYESADGALVLAAGIPDAWLEGEGVGVRGLATPYGPLTYSLRREGPRIVVEIPDGNAKPPGGLRLRLQGREEIRIERLPARLELEFR
jgi:hypothetical protein